MKSSFLPRRRFLQALSAGLICSPAILRGNVARAQTGGFTVMALGGSWGADIKQLLGNPFSKAHGVNIGYDERPNAQQLVAIQAMRGNPSVDVVELGGQRMGQAIALGLVEPFDAARIPNLATVSPAYKNSHYADRYIAAWGMTVNTRTVPKSEVEQQGWQLLLDKKYKGQVAIPAFGWLGEMWMHAANLSLGGTYDNFDPVIEFCRKVIKDNNGLVMNTNDQGVSMLSTGEVVAAPFWAGRTYMMQDKGIEGVEFVYPKGWVAYGSGFMIVKGSRNLELAEKFVDLSLSPEVQIPIAKKWFYAPTNSTARGQLTDQPRLTIDPAEAAKAQVLDYEQMYKFSDRYLERMNREVLG